MNQFTNPNQHMFIFYFYVGLPHWQNSAFILLRHQGKVTRGFIVSPTSQGIDTISALRLGVASDNLDQCRKNLALFILQRKKKRHVRFAPIGVPLQIQTRFQCFTLEVGFGNCLQYSQVIIKTCKTFARANTFGIVDHSLGFPPPRSV